MSLENVKENNTVESLFKQYYNPLYNFVKSKINNSEDAKEVVQDVFVKLWNAKSKIDLNSPTIKSYLYTMARNTMIDAIRKKKDQSDVDIDNLDAGNIATDDSDTLDPYIIRTEIMKSLEILKPKTKQIFQLNKLQGYTYEEISQHLDISVRTVEDNMSRAYRLLREELKKNEIFS